MDSSGMASDQVIAELVSMGFEFPDVIKAIEAVGPSVESAVGFILNDSRRSTIATSSSNCSESKNKSTRKRTLSTPCSIDRMRQSTLIEHLQSAGAPKRSKTETNCDFPVPKAKLLAKNVKASSEPDIVGNSTHNATLDTTLFPFSCHEESDIGPDWEQKVNNLLQKHFGFSSLKNFQKETLVAWLTHQDCLVLAATGSGKSLCFQIPALLTGKVVVVISPLISLMHDQCLKLAKHGVSACFLGSGQTDSSIEQKAMRGMYSIIYVCPETILRLIKQLQGLAESRGIALFAIDEVHCVSKWGHDFRPDYRRLAVLRENFRADRLKFLKFDIPLMALTATATVRVRDDILNSLCMSKDTKIVLTSFFRPNLRFSVKHSRTSSPLSFEKDFSELIDVYSRKKRPNIQKDNLMLQDLDHTCDSSVSSSQYNKFEPDRASQYDSLSDSDDEEGSVKANCSAAKNENKLTVEFLEDEFDLSIPVDDLDVCCGEFVGQSPSTDLNNSQPLEIHGSISKEEHGLELQQGHLEGPTIIYVPTRKETLNIAKFLCKFGVKAAAYNAKLPKAHLRRVHKEFHENTLEVIVATIAFGMGIDKSNVRRIIHYGWPQSLEAYYQEAGRAGRDGKLADCILFANLSRTPSLLPSKRSVDQTKQAKRMLSDCFRYGMNTTSCRAKILVEYFGEAFGTVKCSMCDICVNGPPEMLDFKAEADAFMRVLATHYGQSNFAGSSYEDEAYGLNNRGEFVEKLNTGALVSKIREQFENFVASDKLWWQGLARILEDKGFIREADDMVHVQIKFPEPTKRGLEFLQQARDEPLNGYPEGDMLYSMAKPKSYSSFSEWGKGWADPEIRRQRLGRKTRSGQRNPRKRKSKRIKADMKTVRGRLAAKLNK